MICQSIGKVRFSDDTVDYATVLVAHSETAPASVGTTFTQGQLWYHTGNYGVSTGDHLHMEVAKGHVSWDQTGQHLDNPYHMYDMLAVNDTIIDDGMGLDWKEYVRPAPADTRKNHFNWAVFTKNIRKNRRNRIS